MKKILFILSVFILMNYGCKDETPSLIQNPSAEITNGSEVTGWEFDPAAVNVTHFYDNVAIRGNKSLFIDAGRFASGRWSTHVLSETMVGI